MMNRHFRISQLFATLAFSVSVLHSAETKTDDAVDLICHTDNKADCYPKVFQATKEFQKVHHDQDLPSGLHVRLNIWTGEKEAKLNDPTEQADQGTIDRAVVVVDREPSGSEEAPLPSGAPSYDSIGSPKPPGHGSTAFLDYLAILKKGLPKKRLLFSNSGSVERFGEALVGLEDLSHDVYYGSKLAEDDEVLKSLLCLMSSRDVFRTGSDDNTITWIRQAASVVSAALQNNAVALARVDTAWSTSLSRTKCTAASSGDGRPASLRDIIFGSFLPHSSSGAGEVEDPGALYVKARLSAIKGLLRSDGIMRDFLASDGMAYILTLLVAGGPQYESAKATAAYLVIDSFLDADMGATLGRWPRKKPKSSQYCLDFGSVVPEECWDFYVERLADAHKAEASDDTHWSVLLSTLLQQQRAAQERVKDEL